MTETKPPPWEDADGKIILGDVLTGVFCFGWSRGAAHWGHAGQIRLHLPSEGAQVSGAETRRVPVPLPGKPRPPLLLLSTSQLLSGMRTVTLPSPDSLLLDQHLLARLGAGLW